MDEMDDWTKLLTDTQFSLILEMCKLMSRENTMTPYDALMIGCRIGKGGILDGNDLYARQLKMMSNTEMLSRFKIKKG